MVIEEEDVIVSLNYDEDSERKRAEYLLKNSEDVSVSKLEGMTRVLSGEEDNIEGILKELKTKVDENNLSYGRIGDTNWSTVPREYAKIKFDVEKDSDKAQWTFEAIKKGALSRGHKPESISNSHWEISDNKLGDVNLAYDLSNVENTGEIEVHLYGAEGVSEVYGEALEDCLEPTIKGKLNSIEKIEN